MDERTFIEGSREAWERLESTLSETRSSGVTRLDATRLRQLHDDYRRSAADLAYAQTHFPESQSAEYLNSLVGRAHAELYGAAPRRLASMWGFFARGYPALVREHWREVSLSAALLFGATALGFILAYVNYPLARLFIPEALREGVSDTLESGTDLHAITAPFAPLLTAGITANNIQVAFLAFAGGMTFGALTVYALMVNGLLLGALAGAFDKAGGSLYFWALIVPHGSLELPAIVLAGAAGLMIGRALISPGDLPRSAALKRVSPNALRVLLGTLPLFVVAGAIEAFITPAPLPESLKLAFGAVLAALLLTYLLFAGRWREQ